jgi:dephospho-CoA kinase
MVVKTFFITGAEGVGKSSVLNILKKNFPSMDIHDFDEVGVPLNPPLKWRMDTTIYWIKEGIKNQKKGKFTCIIGLSFPAEINSFKESKEINKIKFCLLDISEKERKRRLIKRDSSKDIINDLENLYNLRKQIKRVNGHIIDVSKLSLDEVGESLSNWMKESLR